ncbi:putative NACHT domain-containing protein [Seiridium cardinale]|uniref:NACHT domain-containing protein n=1 Tax=Seiridium cardinale TaxID=138064 RepID=A0ABR2XK38_9PEZI
MQGLQYYHGPLRYPIGGRAAEASVSDDGQIFRVGHGLFVRTQDTNYTPLDNSSMDISCRGEFIIVASHRRITDQNLNNPVGDIGQGTLEQPLVTRKLSYRQNKSPSTTMETKSDSDSMDGGDTSIDEDESLDAHSTLPAHNDTDSDGVESHFEEDIHYEHLPDDSEDFDDTDSSLETLSAEESASDGSRSAMSDDVEDDGLWNDFASDSEDRNIDDNELDTDEEVVGLGLRSENEEVEYSTSDESVSEAPSLDSNDLSDKISGGGMESPLRKGSSDSSSTESYASSEGEALAAETFERLFQTERKKDPMGKVSEMSVFKIDPPTQKPDRVSHYSRSAASPLFSSPPIFHPTLDLVVWPVGGESLLFANFTKNTYSTRLLGTGPRASCHISVQCHFSPCGKYLHIASLDGCIEIGKIDRIRAAPRLTLKVHVSTHELSRSKPERCPPRLIYHTSVGLDREIRQDQKMSVPNLPYNLTWTPDYVYVTESSKLLSVIRISLFKGKEEDKTNGSSNKDVFKNAEDISLPASAGTRKIHFIPNDMDQNH